jgi:hypothetical protein
MRGADARERAGCGDIWCIASTRRLGSCVPFTGLGHNGGRSSPLRDDCCQGMARVSLVSRTYPEESVAVLDANPDVVYCVATPVLKDALEQLLGSEVNPYQLDAESPATRFWNQFVVVAARTIYGLVRTGVMRRIGRHRKFLRAERVVYAQLSMYGRFKVLAGSRSQHSLRLGAGRS